MKTNGLEAGGIEQRQIETGSHFLFKHRPAQTNALSHRLKACGRRGIDKVLRLQRAVYGGCLHAHAVRIPRLIGIQGRVPAPFLEKLCRLGVDPGDCGMVRQDKGGEKLGENG